MKLFSWLRKKPKKEDGLLFSNNSTDKELKKEQKRQLKKLSERLKQEMENLSEVSLKNMKVDDKILEEHYKKPIKDITEEEKESFLEELEISLKNSSKTFELFDNKDVQKVGPTFVGFIEYCNDRVEKKSSSEDFEDIFFTKKYIKSHIKIFKQAIIELKELFGDIYSLEKPLHIKISKQKNKIVITIDGIRKVTDNKMSPTLIELKQNELKLAEITERKILASLGDEKNLQKLFDEGKT